MTACCISVFTILYGSEHNQETAHSAINAYFVGRKGLKVKRC
jgi:hypothetical protein